MLFRSRLVAADEREAPSFLFESVEGGERQGRHSILGAHPVVTITSYGAGATVRTIVQDHVGLCRSSAEEAANPLEAVRRAAAHVVLVSPSETQRKLFPSAFLGGWVGYAGYDTVRYVEGASLSNPPRDDRALPDLSFGFYDGVVVFDHVDKLVYVVQLVLVTPEADAASQ